MSWRSQLEEEYLKEPEKELIDLDELVYGEPDFEDVVAFWKEGEWHGEENEVDAIKRWLRTPEHKRVLDELDLSIYDVLNGHYAQAEEGIIYGILREWNEKLGFRAYGAGEI
jgi:O-methyltransferase involved in polyketide biosynthesis